LCFALFAVKREESSAAFPSDLTNVVARLSLRDSHPRFQNRKKEIEVDFLLPQISQEAINATFDRSHIQKT
jgi:hypothetical protein